MLGQDRYAAPAFELAGVYDSLRDRVVLSVQPRLLGLPIHKRRHPVVNMGDDLRAVLSVRSSSLKAEGPAARADV